MNASNQVSSSHGILERSRWKSLGVLEKSKDQKRVPSANNHGSRAEYHSTNTRRGQAQAIQCRAARPSSIRLNADGCRLQHSPCRRRDGRQAARRRQTAFQMVRDPNVRRSRSLNLTHALAYTLIIVGAIFLGLTLGGDYPAPKATLQAAGVYTEYWVKYALYLAGGIGGVAAVLLANRALAAGRSTVLAQIVLLLTVLDVLATIGLTIYLMTLDLGYDWWTILLNVLMLIQRTLYFAVASMALWTLREAHSDETVAAHVAQGQGYAAPAKDEGFMSKQTRRPALDDTNEPQGSCLGVGRPETRHHLGCGTQITPWGSACSGQLSAAEYEARKKACTAAALASLRGSGEYKAWQRGRKQEQRAASAGMPLINALLLALLLAVGSAGVWRATRPEPPAVLAQPSSPAGSPVAREGSVLPAGLSVQTEEDRQATMAAEKSQNGPEEAPASWRDGPGSAPATADPVKLFGAGPEPASETRQEATVGTSHEAAGASPPWSSSETAEQTEAAAPDPHGAGPAALGAQLASAYQALHLARFQAGQYVEQLAAVQLELAAALASRQVAEEATAAAALAASAATEAGAAAAEQLQLVQAASQQASQAAATREAALRGELEAAAAALQRAEAAATEAAAGQTAGLQAAWQRAEQAEQTAAALTAQLEDARAQASTAAAAAAEQDAVLREELAALAAQLQQADKQASVAAAAAAEQEAAVRSELAALRQQVQQGEAQAGAAAALAATQDAALRSELQAAVAAQQQAQVALAVAMKDAATAGRQAAEARLAASAATSAATSAGRALALETCSAGRLWLEQPQLLTVAGVAAATALLACVLLTGWVVRWRALAAAAAVPPAGAKQLAQLQSQLEQAQAAAESRAAEAKRAKAAAEAARREAAEKRQWEAAAAQLAQVTAEVPSKKAGGGPAAARTPLAARCSNQQPPMPTSAAAAASAQAVSEMLTENELLKERLADSKQAFAGAAARESTARSAAAGLHAELDAARQAMVAAEAAGMEQQRRLDAELAAVAAERDSLLKQVAELRRQLAARDDELAELGDCLGGLERENSNLEAQVDQVTQALIERQAGRGDLERRVAELEQELSSLGMLAGRLEGDKADLEEQLAEAREAQAELCLASQQYIAADSAIKSIQASEDTEQASGLVQDDLRRAVEEKVLALDLLASAERKLVEQDTQDGVPTLPVHQLLLSGRRLSGGLHASTPRSRSARMASFLGSKLDRVARLLAGDADPAAGSDYACTPTSARSVAGPAAPVVGGLAGSRALASVDGPLNIASWLSHTQGLFSSAGEVLGQELQDCESGDPHFSIAAISLPTSARQREQQAALEAALEHSSLEVQDLLAALDATAVATGPAAASGGGGGPAVAAGDSPQLQAAERAVLAVRQSLAAAHDGVQGARRRVQEAAGEAEGLKRQHGAVRQQVEQLQLAVDGAQAGVEAALQDKQGAERAVARAEAELAAAQAGVESAAQERQAADPTQRQQCQDGYERSVQRRSACLAAKQAALGSKQAAIDAARAAAEALAAAEEEVEGAVDQLCSLEDAIHAAVRRRSSAQDELLQRQSTLAQVVAEASTALEQHAAATRVAAATAVPGGTAAAVPAAGQRPSPLSAQQLAALASPQSGGLSRRSTGGEGAGGGHVSQRTVLAGAAVEAERVAELMEDSWFSPRLPGSELDRGEQAAPVWEQEQEVVAEN
ncbi:hypothetical protein ACK3TF_003458 [Chlorella vulgaris]